jgi:hypothetical protein
MNAEALRAPRYNDLPNNMKGLPLDHRGFPIPFFVAYVDEKPNFNIADARKVGICWSKKLCWVCGKPMGAYQSFVIGPMCSINKVSSEPPSHLTCCEWSVKHCPFLTRPRMRRNPHAPEGVVKPGGIMIDRNPGVSLIWSSKTASVFKTATGPLFDVGEPTAMPTWWKEGRPATRAEVIESIDSGIGTLLDACSSEPSEKQRKASLDELHRRMKLVIDTLLPAS